MLKALGFDPEDLPTAFKAPELAVTRWGTMKIDHRSMMTNLPGVFAAGDIVRGASLVVWAIRDGRDAAEHIHGYVDAEGRSQRRSGRGGGVAKRAVAPFPLSPSPPVRGERAGVRAPDGRCFDRRMRPPHPALSPFQGARGDKRKGGGEERVPRDVGETKRLGEMEDLVQLGERRS